jgi:hypothetical protein
MEESMMDDEICEIHTDFLKGLFLLYLSLDESIADDESCLASKLILAKYLEIFHDEFLLEMKVSDPLVYLDNFDNFQCIVHNFFLDNGGQHINLEFKDGNIFAQKPYFTVSEVKSQIHKLVKNLYSRLAVLACKSRPPSKNKKLPFE